jgi:hypothetical protein
MVELTRQVFGEGEVADVFEAHEGGDAGSVWKLASFSSGSILFVSKQAVGSD